MAKRANLGDLLRQTITATLTDVMQAERQHRAKAKDLREQADRADAQADANNGAASLCRTLLERLTAFEQAIDRERSQAKTKRDQADGR